MRRGLCCFIEVDYGGGKAVARSEVGFWYVGMALVLRSHSNLPTIGFHDNDPGSDICYVCIHETIADLNV